MATRAQTPSALRQHVVRVHEEHLQVAATPVDVQVAPRRGHERVARRRRRRVGRGAPRRDTSTPTARAAREPHRRTRVDTRRERAIDPEATSAVGIRRGGGAMMAGETMMAWSSSVSDSVIVASAESGFFSYSSPPGRRGYWATRVGYSRTVREECAECHVYDLYRASPLHLSVWPPFLPFRASTPPGARRRDPPLRGDSASVFHEPSRRRESPNASLLPRTPTLRTRPVPRRASRRAWTPRVRLRRR